MFIVKGFMMYPKINIKQFLKPCIYSLFASCIGTQAFALNGPTVIGDCGQQKVQPDDDFSQLLYHPGDLPPAALCKYPNVGALFMTTEAAKVPGPNRLFPTCSGSLIHIDNKKAIILTAGHCLFGLAPPYYATFEPQPLDPYSARIVGRDFLVNPANVIQATGGIIQPLYSGNIVDPYDVAVLVFDNTNGQVSSFGITPLRIPNNPNYLESFQQQGDLNKLTWMGVGIAGYERPLGNDPDATVADNYKQRRNAQHNRTYAPLDFYRYGKQVISGVSINGIMINQQTNPGRDGMCNGDSGSPLIINNDLAIGVASFVLGVNGNPSPGFCDHKALYVRVDLPENHQFITCATDPNKTAAEALQCPAP